MASFTNRSALSAESGDCFSLSLYWVFGSIWILSEFIPDFLLAFCREQISLARSRGIPLICPVRRNGTIAHQISEARLANLSVPRIILPSGVFSPGMGLSEALPPDDTARTLG